SRFFFFSFCLHCSRDVRDLHSFPTRRSSDLVDPIRRDVGGAARTDRLGGCGLVARAAERRLLYGRHHHHHWPVRKERHSHHRVRSEEHTSELQSRENLVCRLLLEKKKKKTSR